MASAFATPSASSQIISTSFYCPACEQPFAPSPPGRAPVLLSPCGHSLCGDCFGALPSPVRCLVCHVRVSKRTSNTVLAELAVEVLHASEASSENQVASTAITVGDAACPECEAVRDDDDEEDSSYASFVCTTCNKPLCEDHARLHAKRKRTHTVVECEDATAAAPSVAANMASRLVLCDYHPQLALDRLCFTHRVVVCQLCAATKHSAPCCYVWDVADVDAKDLLQYAIEDHADRASSTRTKAKRAAARVQVALEDLKVQRDTCRERVNAAMDEIVAGVEAHRAKLLAQVDGAYNERAKSLEATLDRLAVSVGQLEACVALGANGKGVVDVSKLCEVEAACGGMSQGLCGMYMGVDVPTRLEVVADVGGVLSALEGCVKVHAHELCVEKCEVSGAGLRGFTVDYSSCRDSPNVIDVRCVDGSGAPLGWLTADDVHVTVRCVENAVFARDVQCDVKVTSGGDGVFRVVYNVDFPCFLFDDFINIYNRMHPGDTYRSDFQRALMQQVELCVSVCGKCVYGDGPFRVHGLYSAIDGMKAEQVSVADMLTEMAKHVDVPYVQQLGLEALLIENLAPIRLALDQLDRVLDHAMVVCAAHVQNAAVMKCKCCFDLLINLLIDGDAAVKAPAQQKLRASDGLHMMLSVARHYSDCTSATTQSVFRVVMVVCRDVASARAAFVSADGLSVVVRALASQDLSHKRSCAANATSILADCLISVDGTAATLVELGAVPHLLRFVDARADMEVSIFNALFCLCQVSEVDEGRFAVHAAGAVRHVLPLMERYVQDNDVQRSCVGMLLKLAKGSPVRQRAIVLAGAIPRVLRAMDAHVDDEQLQIAACKALRALAAGDACAVTQVRDGDGVAVVQRAMQRHPSLAAAGGALLQLIAPQP